MDYIWYMWCGPEAPLFDKDKMATFERYFVEDKELHKEKKGYYYTCLLYTSRQPENIPAPSPDRQPLSLLPD